MAYESLQRPVGTLDLLLYLLRHGKANVATIILETGLNRERFYVVASHLRTLGFAYEDKQTGYPTYTYWGLTQAGERIARALGPALELLSATTAALEMEVARLDEAGEPSTVPRRIELLGLLVDQDFSAGRWDAAEGKAARIVDLARGSNDARAEVRGRLALGKILQKRDRHDDARRELADALARATASGANDLASEAEYLLGSDLERQGRWADALERFAAATSRATAGGDPLRAALARQATARIFARRGRLEESLAVLKEAASAYEALGAEDELPRVYVSLGSTAHSLDRGEEAGAWFEKGVDAARRVGDIRMEAYGLVYGAAHWGQAGQYRRAEGALARAGSIFTDLGERMGLGSYELNLAVLLSVQDRLSEAEPHFDRALEIARETGNRYQEAWVQLSRGQMAKRRGRDEEARRWLTEARRIFQETGSEARVARCDEELRDLTPR